MLVEDVEHHLFGEEAGVEVRVVTVHDERLLLPVRRHEFCRRELLPNQCLKHRGAFTLINTL